MEVEGLPLDLLSNLPTNIIQTILTLLPIRDAFKTSIMSRNWRNHCFNIPILTFDDETFKGSIYSNLSVKCKILHVIYPILLLHQGPITDFAFFMSESSSCCEIDQIILHLSRTMTVKKFSLCIDKGDAHKLLPSFFKMKNLEHLELGNCVFQPPLTFKGFSRLTCIYFYNVSITADVLLRFISNSPRLTNVYMYEEENHLIGSWYSGFVELFKYLPLIESLYMNSYTIKWFASGMVPQKLPSSLLVHLKYLRLDGLCFEREIEIREVLLLVLSCPNTETIVMEMCPAKVVSQSAMNVLDLQDYSDVILDHLHVIDITNFTNIKPGMDFVKLILTKSPILKVMYIKINKLVDIHDEVKMLKELIEYPRASSRAKIIFKRP